MPAATEAATRSANASVPETAAAVGSAITETGNSNRSPAAIAAAIHVAAAIAVHSIPVTAIAVIPVAAVRIAITVAAIGSVVAAVKETWIVARIKAIRIRVAAIRIAVPVRTAGVRVRIYIGHRIGRNRNAKSYLSLQPRRTDEHRDHKRRRAEQGSFQHSAYGASSSIGQRFRCDGSVRAFK